MLPSTWKEVAERLRKQVAKLPKIPRQDRKTLIQLAILDSGLDLDPDDPALIRRIEATVFDPPPPILPRVIELTGMKHGQVAELIGKSRPTVQAYVSGRLDENLDDDARETLARVVERRFAEVNQDISALLRDLRGETN